MKNSTRRSAIATVAMTGLCLSVAGPAQATYGLCVSSTSGHGCAISSDTKVSDDLADGHWAVLQWKSKGRLTRSLWDHNGANNGFTKGSLGSYSRSGFKSRLCKGDWSTKRVFSCGGWI